MVIRNKLQFQRSEENLSLLFFFLNTKQVLGLFQQVRSPSALKKSKLKFSSINHLLHTKFAC